MNTLIKVIVVLAVLGGVGWYFFMAGPEAKRKVRMQAELATSDVKRAGSGLTAGVKLSGDKPTAAAVAAAATCRENLKRIEAAKRQAVESGVVAGGEVPVDAVLKAMNAPALPVCPEGGKYVIGPVNTTVRCSINSNGTADTTDDHNIQGF